MTKQPKEYKLEHPVDNFNLRLTTEIIKAECSRATDESEARYVYKKDHPSRSPDFKYLSTGLQLRALLQRHRAPLEVTHHLARIRDDHLHWEFDNNPARLPFVFKERQKWLRKFQATRHEIDGVLYYAPDKYEVMELHQSKPGVRLDFKTLEKRITFWRNGKRTVTSFGANLYEIRTVRDEITHIERRSAGPKGGLRLHSEVGPAILTREKSVWALDGSEIGVLEWFQAGLAGFFMNKREDDPLFPVERDELDEWFRLCHVDQETRLMIKLHL